MKKITKIFLLSMVIAIFLAGNAMATVTDIITVLADNYIDSGAEAVGLTDMDGTTDDATAFLFFEFPDIETTDPFGIYDYTDNLDGTVTMGNYLEVFDGADAPGDSATLRWNLIAGTVTNQGTGVSAVIDDTFGFYMGVVPGLAWFSHTSLNVDDLDHLALFDTSDNSHGELGGSDVMLVWHNEGGLTMLVGVTDVAPIPEPGTLMLLGSGLAGVGFYTRRRKK